MKTYDPKKMKFVCSYASNIKEIDFKITKGGFTRPKEQNRHDIAVYSKEMAKYIFQHNIKSMVYAINEDSKKIAICRDMEEIEDFYDKGLGGSPL